MSGFNITWKWREDFIHDNSDINLNSITVDENGNIYVATYTDFGSGFNIHVYKLNSGKTILASVTLTSTTIDSYPVIRYDNNGHLVIAYQEKIGANYYISLVKLTTNLAVIWSRDGPNYRTASTKKFDMAVNAQGDICVAMYNYTSSRGNIIKYSTMGYELWRYEVSYLNFDNPCVAINSARQIFVSFHCNNCDSSGNYRIIILKISPAGSLLNAFDNDEINYTDDSEYPKICVHGNDYLYFSFQSGIENVNTNLYDKVVLKANSNGEYVWVKQVQSMNSHVDVSASKTSVAIYSDNSIVGCYSATYNNTHVAKIIRLDSGGKVLTSFDVPSTGSDVDCVICVNNDETYIAYQTTSGIDIIKLSTTYSVVWNVNISSTQTDTSPSIYFANGLLYYAGVTTGSFQTSSGGTDIFFGALNASDGTHSLTTKQPPTLNSSSNESNPQIVANAQGEIIISFSYDSNVGIVCYSADGTYLWAVRDANINPGTNSSMAIDTTGYIIISYYTSSVVAVAKIDRKGNIIWINKNIPSTTSVNAPSVVTDSDNNIYVAYTGTGAISGGTSSGGSDLVLVKLDYNGNVIWSQQKQYDNSAQNEINQSIVVDSDDNLIVMYETQGVVPGRMKDFIVGRMDQNDGSLYWINNKIQLNTDLDDVTPDICLGQSGCLYVAYISNYNITLARIDPDSEIMWSTNTGFNTSNYNISPRIIFYGSYIYLGFKASTTLGVSPYDSYLAQFMESETKSGIVNYSGSAYYKNVTLAGTSTHVISPFTVFDNSTIKTSDSEAFVVKKPNGTNILRVDTLANEVSLNNIIPIEAEGNLGYPSHKWNIESNVINSQTIYSNSISSNYFNINNLSTSTLLVASNNITPVLTSNTVGEQTNLSFIEFQSNSASGTSTVSPNRMRIAMKYDNVSNVLCLITEKWDYTVNGWIYLSTLASADE